MSKVRSHRLARVAGFLLIAGAALAVPRSSAQSADVVTQISGEWRGTSNCAQKGTACHGEVNVYRFARIGSEGMRFSGAGSKIVAGKEILMGTLEWQYDAAAHVLMSEAPAGTFRLLVNGNTIEGTLGCATIRSFGAFISRR